MNRNSSSEKKELAASAALITAEIIFLLAVFFVSVTSLIVIIRRIFFIKEDVFDQKVFDFLLPYVTDTNTAVMLFFTFFGSYYFMVPAWLLVFSYYFFIRKNKGYFNRMVTIAVSNLLLLWTLKFFFNRPRPLIPLLKEIPGLSFPSGHAFMGMIFYGLFICIAYRDIKQRWKRWAVIFILFAFLILVGFSRVYLRVHYFSDIIAGYCFGIISLTILFWLLNMIEKFNKVKMTLSTDTAIPIAKKSL